MVFRSGLGSASMLVSAASPLAAAAGAEEVPAALLARLLRTAGPAAAVAAASSAAWASSGLSCRVEARRRRRGRSGEEAGQEQGRGLQKSGIEQGSVSWPFFQPLLEKSVALLYPLTLKSQWPCSLNLRAVLELPAPDALPAAASEPLGYMCWRRGAIMALTLPPLAVMSYEHPHWGLEGRRAARSRGAAGQGWDCSSFGSRQASCCSFAFAALPKDQRLPCC